MWPEDGMDKELQAKIVERTALKRPGSPDGRGTRSAFLCNRSAVCHWSDFGGGWRSQ